MIRENEHYWTLASQYVHLIRHVDRNSLLVKRQRRLAIAAEGGNVHQSASVGGPSRNIHLEFID